MIFKEWLTVSLIVHIIEIHQFINSVASSCPLPAQRFCNARCNFQNFDVQRSKPWNILPYASNLQNFGPFLERVSTNCRGESFCISTLDADTLCILIAVDTTKGTFMLHTDVQCSLERWREITWIVLLAPSSVERSVLTVDISMGKATYIQRLGGLCENTRSESG